MGPTNVFHIRRKICSSGKPVCCAVIFQSKHDSSNFEWAHGIDISKEPVRNESGNMDIMKNIGPGKYHPGGPTCNFNGTTVECLTFSSESGRITAKILLQTLS